MMARRTLDGARIIITGASSGIGLALAKQLGKEGSRLLVTARREGRLRQLSDTISKAGKVTRPITVAGDITNLEVQEQIIETAERDMGGLDILVNNAGLGALGPFSEATPERLRRILEVNFIAPVELTRKAIPLLRKGHNGLIVNVGSVLGHRAVPGKSEYCASKFALHGFSDSLRCELASQGIDVLLVSPSTTSSEFFDQVMTTSPSVKSSLHNAMPPEKVARRTMRAIQRGQHELILSTGGKLLVWIDRLCPPLANRLVARFG
ncbi:MAG: SDR family NAD(P)-dependent oxidoreductase [Planctomycetota bacterium]|nr:SDR family NAD(P)-dependent oxidoreductase [Planctomycetota bacterium]